MKSKIFSALEFLYAFPTQYMRSLPNDRNMIFPTTGIGALMGGTAQTIATHLVYNYYTGETDFTTTLPLSIVPIATNIISGLYEWSHYREDRTKKHEEDLLKILKDN